MTTTDKATGDAKPEHEHGTQRGEYARRLFAAWLLGCLLLQPVAAPALPADFTPEELAGFVTSLKGAVASPSAVEGYILFPLKVTTGPGTFHFVTRAQFVADYYKVFTPRVKALILNQDVAALQRSGLGVAIGDGVVWIESTCGSSGRQACAKGTLRIVSVDLRGE